MKAVMTRTETGKMQSFASKGAIFDWFRDNTTSGFYNETIAHFEKSYGDYEDSTNMADAYMYGAKHLLQKRVSEEDILKLDLGTIGAYSDFVGRLTVDEFLTQYKKCNSNIKALKLHLAKNLGERLLLNGFEKEGTFYQHLPNAYREIIDSMDEENGHLLLSALLSRNFCIANLSGIDDSALRKVSDYLSLGGFREVSIRSGDDILLYLLRIKLSECFGEQPLVSFLLTETSKMNPQKLYWVAIRSERVRFIRPLYQVLDESFEFDPALLGGLVTKRYAGGNVIYFEIQTGASCTPFSYLPPPIEVDSTEMFPVEKSCGSREICKIFWQYPFIISDGTDWGYAWEHGKNTLVVMDAWRRGYDFNRAMMSYFRCVLSGSFPDGSYHEAVFQNGEIVDLRRFFMGEKKEVIAELNENGFPDCSFR